MSHAYLYLSADQAHSCLRALNTVQRWVQGDVGVFAELANAGFLRNKDGKPLSLSLWSTIVEPALTEYASLAAGTTPGVISDVHDPATHPLAAQCLHMQLQWGSVKVSKKCTTLAALPLNVEVHRIGEDAFDVYKRVDGTSTVVGQNWTAAKVESLGIVENPTFQIPVDKDNVHRLLRVLDIYSRILMNQWEYVKELTDDRWEGRRNDWHEQVELAVKTFKEPWTGYSMNASSGIHSPAIHPDAEIVFSVQKSLRHLDMVQRLGYTSRGVSTDAPMRGDAWPLVDSPTSAGLAVLPIGGAIVAQDGVFYVVGTYSVSGPQAGPSLASSYSPVSLLDALAYTQANPGKAPTF